ncbi:hypothetical protein Angca_003823 [Angiostrongylus cantonensis]|nr:hypothetical protein Angca_003823 [Angiostrongylus cantonensis]
MSMPYVPPPDYPMVESQWRSKEFRYNHNAYVQDSPYFDQRFCRYRLPPSHHHCQPQMLLRARQFPEVAGIYGYDEQPSLRRFTRYSHSMMEIPTSAPAPQPPLPPPPPPPSPSPPTSTAFSKNSKKASFFNGNWTYRDRKQTRPGVMPHEGMKRDDCLESKTLSESRSGRSKSETALPRQSDVRVLVNVQRTVDERLKTITHTMPETAGTFTTRVIVDDGVTVLRPRKEQDIETSNSRYGHTSSNQLRNSCPDLKIATALPSSSNNRVQRRRNRRAKEKMKEACWRRKPLEEWALDDVVLWLQACNLDDVASLFIGYDLRGTDLLSWDHHCLSHLGVTSASIREKILDELATIRERGSDDMRETEKRTGHRALFDIVKQSSYDQVLAVETPLTTRDIVVTHGRLCCLQITKVNGVNLPLRENDCLLEINDRPGEQFKSALMLTKLISDANGVPIRFVVLRMKTVDRVENGSNETSSSGVSSSPRSPSD